MLAAGASLALLIAVYFFALPKKASFEQEKIEKILEFKSAYFSGHEKGKKVWEFYADYGWSGKDKERTYLLNVTKGRFYKNGDLIVSRLKANRVIAWQKSKIVEAFGQPENQITAESGLSALVAFTPKGKRKYAGLTADYIQYNPDARASSVKGHIKLIEKDSTLFSEIMTIDHDKELAIANTAKFIRKDISLAGDELNYFAKDERLSFKGKITSKIKSKPNISIVKCEQMEFFTDDKKDVNVSGSVEVYQGKKIALSNYLVYKKPLNKIILTGNVKTVIEKGQALIKSDTAQKLKSEEAKKLLREKTMISSGALELSTKNGDAKASGKVIVTQKGREGKSDEASYSENSEIITLLGNVYLKKKNQWVKCKKIAVSVKNETFDAVGSVEAEFRIKK